MASLCDITLLGNSKCTLRKNSQQYCLSLGEQHFSHCKKFIKMFLHVKKAINVDAVEIISFFALSNFVLFACFCCNSVEQYELLFRSQYRHKHSSTWSLSGLRVARQIPSCQCSANALCPPGPPGAPGQPGQDGTPGTTSASQTAFLLRAFLHNTFSSDRLPYPSEQSRSLRLLIDLLPQILNIPLRLNFPSNLHRNSSFQ